ncbi:MAG: hypothetical protein ABIQ31_09100 [Ferruginibacter sp.]
MRFSLLLLLVFAQLLGNAQKSTREFNAWDTLRMRTAMELKQYNIIVQQEQCSTDTTRKNNYIIITYFDANKNKLQQISNYLDSNGCVSGITSEYYNAAALVKFRNGNKKCCPEKEMEDDYKCFEYMAGYERFEYDMQNRIIVHVSHVTTPMTYKEIFTYSQDGKQQAIRNHIDETSFWK